MSQVLSETTLAGLPVRRGKVRDVYEVPAATVILEAHKELEKLVNTGRQNALKPNLDLLWAQMAYEGLWYEPLMQDLNAFMDSVNAKVEGEVTVRLYPVQEAMSAAVCAFETVDGCTNTVIQTIQAGVPIARCDIVCEKTVDAINKYKKTNYRVAPTVFFEFHGTAAGVQEQAATVEEIAAAHGGQGFEDEDPLPAAKAPDPVHAEDGAGLLLHVCGTGG